MSCKENGQISPDESPDISKVASCDKGDGGQRPSKRPHGSISRARAIVCLVVFVSVVVGLAFHTGWGTLSSMGFGAIAAICPLGALETLIAAHTPIPRLVVSFLAVVVLIALVGRVFCGWACPVPPLQRFFRPGTKKKRKASDAAALREAEGSDGEAPADGANRRCPGCHHGCALAPVGGKRDGFQLDSRHGVLAGALLGTAIFGFPVFCLVCPIGLSLATVIAVWRMLFVHEATWSVLVFPAVVIVELVLLRKWCTKVCPISALMSLIAQRAPLLRPRVKEEVCLRTQGIDCRRCVEVCPEQLDPHAEHIPECTKCGLCVEACPAKAVDLKLFPEKKAAFAKAAGKEEISEG